FARDRRVAEEVHLRVVARGSLAGVLVLGIDLGTQSVKAVVCDAGLAVRGQHAVAVTTAYPAPDRAEQDPRAWDAALGPAIAGALAAADVDAAAIAAIAIAGQLDGCVAVDATGAAVAPALIWQDRRAVDEAARADAREVFAITGQVADASHMAAKIAWLRGRAPGAARFHQPVSYVVERLTGEAVIDPALASTTMLLALATARWAPRLLDAFAIREAELPRLAPATAIAGPLTAEGARLTGLRAGTPVAVGTGDDFAGPLGAGVIAPGPIVCVIGTAEVVGALAAQPVLDRAREPMVETHVYPRVRAADELFFVENPGWLAGGAVRWAARMLGAATDRELDALAGQAPPGADGVAFVPALAGAMTPVWRPHARGTLHGLAAGHDRRHVARAVLEGLAFATRDVVTRLAALGLAARDVVLVGGGARSAVWNQIRADAIGVPHHVAAHADATPIGAAMIAAVAAGLAPDLAALARLAPPPVATIAPDPAAAAPTAEAYARYQRLVAQLAPLAAAPWLQ
ncbi:MAG TPA: FGGY family carbohydrate kinase, partial [Kofleriaceae bacterium]|nr:FGGY family carbohydrate kinase [Kofleriaceae bacterium]